MSISSSISRFTVYLQRHGFWATLRRGGMAARRKLFASRMVLFYCDLSTVGDLITDLPRSLKVERLINQAELRSHDLRDITSFWNPMQARQNIAERFARRASLWLIKCEDRLAGYGWTLQGCTVEPHYFPLGPDDVHFFDFHVFSEYRGRGMNPLLVSCILGGLARECQGRAFIEAAEWNEAQLASLKKTPFRCLGSATKFTVFRRTVVCWTAAEPVTQTQGVRAKLLQPATGQRPSRDKA